MALLPFFRRDQSTLRPPPEWDLSPWRNLDRIGDFSSAPGFPQHFRSHVGDILRHMDESVARMDEDMRKVMMRSPGGGGGGGYDSGSLLSDLHTINPSITNQPNGQQIAHYDFDVKGFRPEEITVKTQDNTLEVIARHEERSPGREVSREFKRTFTIPDGISPDELQGKLIQDGILRVEAPYRPPRALMGSDDDSHLIPITHQYEY